MASGLEACRAGVLQGRPEMLVAEEGVAAAEGGRVDDLLETVIDRAAGSPWLMTACSSRREASLWSSARRPPGGYVVQDEGDEGGDGGA